MSLSMADGDLIHAARLDGLSEFGIVWRIMVPMALPAIIAFSIFSFAGHWNDLFWPLIVAFRNEDIGTDFGPLMATATLVVAPLMIAFLAAQRWFIKGRTHGTVK